MTTATQTVYDELEDRVKPMIKHYLEDLTTHDRNAIEGNPGVPFLHWTREMGTFISHLFAADHESFPQRGEFVPFLFGTADRNHLARVPLDFAEHCHKDGANYLCVLYFDGKRLREIDCLKAVEIAKQHYRSLLKTWNA
jgi:hypothetical protein